MPKHSSRVNSILPDHETSLSLPISVSVSLCLLLLLYEAYNKKTPCTCCGTHWVSIRIGSGVPIVINYRGRRGHMKPLSLSSGVARQRQLAPLLPYYRLRPSYARFPPFRCRSSVAVSPFPLAVAVSVHRCRCRCRCVISMPNGTEFYNCERATEERQRHGGNRALHRRPNTV